MKQRKKAAFCIVLAIACALQIQPLSGFADELPQPGTTPEDGFGLGVKGTYDFDKHELRILPEEHWSGQAIFDINYHPGTDLYSEETDVQHLVIEEGVTGIAAGACRGWKALETVEIANTVTEIGAQVFADCSLLKTIDIPDSVTQIGRMTFENCYSLKKAKLSSSITNLADSLFYNCNMLETVYIPDSVVRIGKNAFCNCSGLTELNLPAQLEYIDEGAFQSCNRIQELVFPAGIQELQASSIEGCTGLKSLTFLNPRCILPTEPSVINCIVRGYPNSTAAEYAREHHLSFEALLERGDVDGSCEVDIADAQTALNAYVEMMVGHASNLRQAQLEAADVNGNGVLEALDAQIIMEYYLQNTIMEIPTSWESLCE